MTNTQRLTTQIHNNKQLNNTIKQLSNKIKEQVDMISAQSNHIKELETQLKKWETLQEKGYTAVAINDGLIMSGVTVAPYSTFIYTQELPKELNTALYQKFPFYELKNGKIRVNSQKYKKYRGVI